jgi:hypothetical protein
MKDMEMHIKCITSFNHGIDSIDTYRLFAEVSDVRVTDRWKDFSNTDACAFLPKSAAFDVDEQLSIYGPEVVCEPKGGFKQQQVIVLRFKCGGRSYEVETEMPVFLMNENGKTIEAHHPLRK